MAEEKKREVHAKKVASGKVKEKSLGDKFSEAFLSEDTRTVGEYIWNEVIVPGFKNIFADVVIGSVETALFGNTRRRSGGGNIVNYNDYSRRNGRSISDRRVVSADRSSRREYNNIILNTRGEAEEVVMEMERLVNKYGFASVADLNSAVGISSKFTDNNWGWTDCRDFRYDRRMGGYILNFADPEYLDD